MNSKALNHLLSLQQTPDQAQQLQPAYDRLRAQDAASAKLTRPEYIQIQNVMPGTSQTLPVSETSQTLDHDVIIMGAISDAEVRTGSLYKGRRDRDFIDTGNTAGLHLSLDAIEGKSVAAAGLPGVQHLVSPFLLEERETLTLDIQDTAVAETVTTVFTGASSFTPDHKEGQLTPLDRRDIADAIARYRNPQPRWLVVDIDFDGAAAETTIQIETSPQDEPLLILGFRSTVTDALVNYGFDSRTDFARDPFAIWAMAAEPGNSRKLYEPLPFKLFLPKKKKLYFSITNTIDGATFAADTGQLQIYATTI